MIAACGGWHPFISMMLRTTCLPETALCLNVDLNSIHDGYKGCARGNFRLEPTSNKKRDFSTQGENIATALMVKPLAFKGDKKSKKRKHREAGEDYKSATTLANTAQNAATADEDDSWVTADAPGDITGPIIFALPTLPPTCIACDANGKVFTSEIENIVEGDLATAEPHDVRQVWVANRVAGTEHVSFKGHHGR